MEFIISTDLEHSLPAVIDFNFEELKTELRGKLDDYKLMVVTENTIKEGKEERAKLNKLKTAIEDRRKEIKRQCLAPYERFESQCKELTGMIDEASGSIDVQVKSFEEAEKQKKRTAIESYYRGYIGDLLELLPFEKFFNSKWLNKSVPIDSAVDELCGAIDKARNDIKIIRAMRIECEDQMVAAYLSTLDMSAALSEKARYEARQEQLAKMAEQEAPTIRTVPGHGEPTKQEAAQVARAIDAAFEDAPAEALKDIKVAFYATTAAFRADMKALTERHNIRYGGIQ